MDFLPKNKILTSFLALISLVILLILFYKITNIIIAISLIMAIIIFACILSYLKATLFVSTIFFLTVHSAYTSIIIGVLYFIFINKLEYTTIEEYKNALYLTFLITLPILFVTRGVLSLLPKSENFLITLEKKDLHQKLKDYSTFITLLITVFILIHTTLDSLNKDSYSEYQAPIENIEQYLYTNKVPLNTMENQPIESIPYQDSDNTLDKHLKIIEDYLFYLQNSNNNKITFSKFISINKNKYKYFSDLTYKKGNNELRKRLANIEQFLLYAPKDKTFIQFSHEKKINVFNPATSKKQDPTDFAYLFASMVIYTLASYYMLLAFSTKKRKKKEEEKNIESTSDISSVSQTLLSISLATVLFIVATSKKE